MASANLPTEIDADKNEEQPAGKKPAVGYFTDEERRIVRLAAVEDDVSRASFISAASVEKAVAVLREKNPSALDDTPWQVAKSA